MQRTFNSSVCNVVPSNNSTESLFVEVTQMKLQIARLVSDRTVSPKPRVFFMVDSMRFMNMYSNCVAWLQYLRSNQPGELCLTKNCLW